MADVVIAGAGISGLGLGVELSRRGLDVLVLESEARAGGKIATRREDGWLCERGPASFSDRGSEVRAFLERVALTPRMLHAGPSAKRREAVVEGAVHAIPSAPAEFLRSPLLPPLARARALGDLALPRGPAARGEEESVAAFARRRLGAVAGARLVYPLASGIYAGDPERISLRSAFPWIAGLEASDRSLLLGMARLVREGHEPGSSLATFPDGMEELTEALARRLGPSLRRGVAVRRVERTGDGFRVHAEEAGRAVEIEAPRVALAVPAHAAAEVVAPLDGRLAEAARGIEYLPVTLVHLGWPVAAFARPIEGYGFLVLPGERSPLLGAFYASTLFSGRAPDGSVLLAARIGGARAPDLAALEDGPVTALAVEEIRRLVGLRGKPSFSLVQRHARALPHYTLGHADRVAEADAAEGRLPGLFVTGNAWRGLGVAECIVQAGVVAERIARARQGR